MKVLSSKPVSNSEVNDILKKRQKDGEIGYEQETALEYSENFTRNTKSESDKLAKQIMKNEKINQETAIKIADLSPDNPDLIKSILLKDKIELSEEEISEIVKIFAK